MTTASSGSFLQLCPENIYRHNYGPSCLVCRCPGRSIPGH